MTDKIREVSASIFATAGLSIAAWLTQAYRAANPAMANTTLGTLRKWRHSRAITRITAIEPISFAPGKK
ncbi:MAG: hypothetical protein H7A02_13850 [Pseudomonadales bacterium]|nr:hypothetical protein [Pseudomonadales bacterium]